MVVPARVCAQVPLPTKGSLLQEASAALASLPDSIASSTIVDAVADGADASAVLDAVPEGVAAAVVTNGTDASAIVDAVANSVAASAGADSTAVAAVVTAMTEGVALPDSVAAIVADSLSQGMIVLDSLLVDAPIPADSILTDSAIVMKVKRDWTTWKPNPKRAMWLALVFPGAGQIYNRKYWKLPIFYGGFVGCFYAWSWNGMMARDYKQAYLDLMDDDDSTKSYEQFMHLGNVITDSNRSRYQELFRKRKDRFERYREISLVCLVAVYALSVIDAYVDASLSEFDISEDLSINLAPAYVNSNMYNNPLKGGGVGVQCNLTF